MKKLDFKSIKLLALMQFLDNYKYRYTKLKDSMEITFNNTEFSVNKIVSILKMVNTEYKTPKLTYQITESDSVISVYNPSI